MVPEGGPQDGRSQSEAADKRVDFAYNDAGQFASVARYASADTSSPVATSRYSYDPTGRVQSLAHRQGSSPTGSLLAGYGFSFDADHRLTGIDFLPDGTNSAFDYSGEDVAYSYDDRDQLTDADYASQGDDAFAYDANGNRVGNQTNAGVTATYDPAGTNNRLTDDGTYEYFYDDEGNRELRYTTATEATTRYTWDHRNRLIQVASSNSRGDAHAVGKWSGGTLAGRRRLK